jgi:membrane-associated phospholipid phosphatase
MKYSFRSLYFQLFIIFFITGMGLLLATDHGDIVLWVNARRVSFLDISMPYVTFLGDGIFYGVISFALLAYRKRIGLFFGLAGILQAVIVAFLKRIVFGPVPRPTKFFEIQGVQLNLLESYDYARVFSFPSGHTMTIFLLTGLLSFTIMPRQWHPVLVVIAVIVGFSRIYLLQHFLGDVLAGAISGVILAALMYPFASRFFGLKK